MQIRIRVEAGDDVAFFKLTIRDTGRQILRTALQYCVKRLVHLLVIADKIRLE